MTTPNEAEGVFNLRDIGGYQSDLSLDARIRHGVLYRYGHLADVTDAGWEKLHELGISAIIDLTSPGEIEMLTGVPAMPDTPKWAQDIRIPYKNGPISIANQREKYKLYRTMGLTAIAQGYFKMMKTRPEVFKEVLTCILDSLEHGKSTFSVHCTLGKDRTGLVSALLLSLAGVPDDIVAEEYSLSEPHLKHIQPQLMELILEVDPFVDDLEELAYFAIECRKETMMSTLKMVQEEYGGVY